MRGGDIEDSYPLSAMQEGLLLHGLSALAGVQLDQRLVGMPHLVDARALRRAFELVVARHAALRTRFVWENVERPIQEVLRSVSLSFDVVDLGASGTSVQSEREARLAKLVARDRERGMVLSDAPLTRVTLFRFAADDHHLLWTFHHSIVDGASAVLVLAEVFEIYDAAIEDRPPVLAPPVPLRVHLDALLARDAKAARAFFAGLLHGVELPTPWPFGVDDVGDVEPGRHGEVEHALSEQASRAIEEAATDAGVTVNTLVQLGISVLLSRYSGESSVVFGATRAGRHTTENARAIVGLLINTVPMRADVADDRRVRDVLVELRQRWIDIRAHEHTPLLEVRDALELRSARPLFEALLVFDAREAGEVLRERSERWSQRTVRHFAHTDAPFTFAIAGGRRMVLRLEHDLSRIEDAAARRVIAHLVMVLTAIPTHMDSTVGELSVLPSEERELVITRWNDTGRRFADTTLHGLVESVAARAPNAIAIETDGERVSYRELVARAERVCDALHERGVGVGSRVCTLMPRGPLLAEAWLGVLRSGAAFVPVDPEHPTGHLVHVLEDSGAELVLTVAGLADRLPEGTDALIVDDPQLGEASADAPRAHPTGAASPEDDAYVIYTSGSTGKPKGVAVSHRAIVNHAHAIREAYDLGPSDRVVQFASPAFDVALEEVFPTWAAGATVVTRPAELLSPVLFTRWANEARATVLNLPTAYFHEWTHAHAAENASIAGRARLVVIGGERVSPAAVERFVSLAEGRVRLVNAYGPTEATVSATLYDATALSTRHPRQEIPIGRPIANVRAYVLDQRRRPCPIGVPGELFLGGAGVASRYVGAPELSRERFLPDPFAATGVGAGRMYRTGDRVRWLPTGDLDFLGRVDAQVKLRGYRIAPGAVERALMAHPSVRDAAVLLDAGAREPRLVAYVARDPDDRTDAATLRAMLRAHLPEPMVPTVIVFMGFLPRNTSDKVDRARLPAPEEEESSTQRESGEPKTPIEKLLADIWAEALGREHVGIHDDFFDLGGHSLLAFKILDRAAQAGVRITTEQLLRHSNVRDLASVATPMVAAQSEGSLVVLRAEGARPPLFLVHSTPGDLLGYVNLVHALGPAQPVYGLQSLGLVSLDDAHLSIEAMTAHYLADVRRVQPHGPYFLGGWCYGGFVAVEMARSLRAAGETVALVALLEAAAPRPSPLVDPRYYAKRARAALSLGPRGLLALLADRAQQAWRMRKQTLRDHLAYEVAEGMLANRERVIELNMAAIARWAPQRYDGHLTLFRASSSDRVSIPDPSMGWASLARSYEVHDVRGRHETILQSPQVRQLAELLLDAIDSASAPR